MITGHSIIDPRSVSWVVTDLRGGVADTGLLSLEERRTATRLRLESKRRTFLAGRVAARRAILALRPDLAGSAHRGRLSVAAAPDGAPEAWLDSTRLDLSVSIAHRADRAAAAAVLGPAVVGCDVERIEPRTNGFVEDFLTAAEAAAVRACAHPDLAANLAWSVKESVLKVRRTGLRRDSRSVAVDLGSLAEWPPTGDPATDDGPPSRDSAPRWHPVPVRDLEDTSEVKAWWFAGGAYVYTLAIGVSPPA